MKKLYITLISLVLALSGTVKAQDIMVIEKNDNTTVKYNVDVIKRVYFEKAQETFSATISTLEAANIESNVATVSAKIEIANAQKEYTVGLYISLNSTPTNNNYTRWRN